MNAAGSTPNFEAYAVRFLETQGTAIKIGSQKSDPRQDSISY